MQSGTRTSICSLRRQGRTKQIADAAVNAMKRFTLCSNAITCDKLNQYRVAAASHEQNIQPGCVAERVPLQAGTMDVG